MKDIVIVEGPTAVGKTTLIGRILEAEPRLVLGAHRPAPDKRIAFDPVALHEWYDEVLDVEMDHGVVLDRWIYSNGAYSTVFKNQIRVAHASLERIAKSFKPVVLFLRADPGVLYGRIQGRDKPRIPKGVGDIEKLIHLVERFAQEEANCGLPKVGIRCHDEDLDSGASLRKALKAIRS